MASSMIREMTFVAGLVMTVRAYTWCLEFQRNFGPRIILTDGCLKSRRHRPQVIHQRRTTKPRGKGREEFHQYVSSRTRYSGFAISVAIDTFACFTDDRLLFHDLTTTVLDGKTLDMPILDTNLSKPSEVPNLIGGILWADAANARLFQYGGEFPDPAVPENNFQLWSYDVYGNNWTTLSQNDQSITRVSFGAGTTVEHLGMGYYLGADLETLIILQRLR
jgi:hypothetical protein